MKTLYSYIDQLRFLDPFFPSNILLSLSSPFKENVARQLEEWRNKTTLSLSPLCLLVNSERTRESGYAIIIPLQVFLPTRNADIRKITRPRHETGLSRRDGVSAIVRARGKRKRWGRVKLFVNFRFAPRLRHHLRSVAITSLSSRVSQSSLKDS